MEQVLEDANKGTFRELASFARAQHSSPSKRRSTCAGYQRLLPTALTVAGGVNSSDHARTFPDLVSLLRSQGCYAALVHPRDLSPNAAVGSALNSILRQFSGLDTDASDMEALHAWYDDQVQEPEKATATGAAAGNGGSPAKRRRAGNVPGAPGSSAPRGWRGHVAVSDTGAQAGDSELGADSEPERDQHAGSSSQSAPPEGGRAAPSRAAQSGEDGEGAHSSCLDASERPLVVVVENTEAADMLSLQDLILVLSEGRARLLVTLVLGMAISVAALRHMLPAKAADVLQAKEFRLMQAKPLLEALVREALLGPRFHGVMFDHRTMDFLLGHFLNHDFNVAFFRRGLQVACMRHFQLEPLSTLAAAAAKPGTAALRAAVLALPEALRGAGRSSGGASCSGAGGNACSLAEQVQGTLHAWSAWAVMLRWVNAAARSVGMGHPTGADKLSLHELYVEASRPGFLDGSGQGAKQLRALCDKLERLSDNQARQLLGSFQACAASVWQGSDALATELRTVEELQRDADEAAAAANGEGPSASQPEDGPSTPIAATPAPRPANRRDSLTLSTMLKQQKVPLGSAQRQRQLFNIATDAKGKGLAASGAVESRGLGARVAVPLACRVAGLLQTAAKQHLATPPSTMSGARGLCCSAAAEVEAMLAAAPRWAVHQALAEREPADYSSCAAGWPDGAAAQLGIAPSMEDAAIAYRLLLEYGECVGVAEWFSSFCAVFEAGAGAKNGGTAEDESDAPKRKRKGRPPKADTKQACITKYMPNQPEEEVGPSRRAGRKLIAIPEAGTAAEEEVRPKRGRPRKTAAAGTESGNAPESGRARGRASHKGKREAASAQDDAAPGDDAPPGSAAAKKAAADAVEVPVQELAVRFNCAMQDLQLLGLIKEADRRRRDNCVQRLVFPMRR